MDDFIKKMQFCYYSDTALENAADQIAAFAEKEGLTGHARSVLIRREQKMKDGKAGADVIWH